MTCGVFISKNRNGLCMRMCGHTSIGPCAVGCRMGCTARRRPIVLRIADRLRDSMIQGRRPGKPLREQFRNLPHGQEQTQWGLLERLEVEMPIEALGPLVLGLHNHRHGRDLLRSFQTAA